MVWYIKHIDHYVDFYHDPDKGYSTACSVKYHN